MTDWRDLALCGPDDADLFFPNKTENVKAKKAKALCAQCAVPAECLAYAVARTGLLGIWGGTNVKERAAIRRGDQRGEARFPTFARNQEIVRLRALGIEPAVVAEKLHVSIETVYRVKTMLERASS
jgi:WhiB family redox-sensing transcriptional regulator